MIAASRPCRKTRRGLDARHLHPSSATRSSVSVRPTRERAAHVPAPQPDHSSIPPQVPTRRPRPSSPSSQHVRRPARRCLVRPAPRRHLACLPALRGGRGRPLPHDGGAHCPLDPRRTHGPRHQAPARVRPTARGRHLPVRNHRGPASTKRSFDLTRPVLCRCSKEDERELRSLLMKLHMQANLVRGHCCCVLHHDD